jgi:creatinine amidohydrolase
MVQCFAMHPRVLRLEKLSWKELEGIDRARALVIVPASPLEEHGPHLPLGVDLFQATFFAERIADEIATRRPEQVVVLHPPIPLGTWTLDFLGSIEIRQRIIRDLLVDVGASLAKHGFEHLVIMNGHGGPGHIVAQEEACDTLRWRNGMRAIAPVGQMIDALFTGGYRARIEAELRAAGGDAELACLATDYHAGCIETSLMLHICPELVHEGWKEFPPVAVERSRLRFDSGRSEGQGLGYLGSPAQASAAIGRAVAAVAIKDLVELTEKLLDGHDVRRAAGSRYARIPLFWTDAKYYAAGIALWLIVLVGWLLY